jgi:hypothetical protein
MRRAALLTTLLAVRMRGVTSSSTLSGPDLDLVDDISRRSFLYFSEQTNVRTGLTLDRAALESKGDSKGEVGGAASIAASGFALTAFCIAEDHRLISRAEGEERVLTTLRFLAHGVPRKNGWFYHYMDVQNGHRIWNSEVSSIDTALLLAGVLTVRSCFSDNSEIAALATDIFNGVDFPWMLNGSKKYFSHGWTPEKGFLPYRWNTYSELLILYVLGIGSPTHPISAAAWDQWKIPMASGGGYTYIGGGPLFIHQYPLAWIDLRDRFTPEAANPSSYTIFSSIEPRANFHTNYYLNSINATRAQQQSFREKLLHKFPGYSENVWGLTSSDGPKGYMDWGGSMSDPRIDGTVAPSAVAGSLMFTPEICIPALRTMLVRYGKKIYGRYGFADAFNPTSGWVSRDVVGIDVGITLLSAENLRTGSVWRWFMSNPEPERALDIVGLWNVHHPLEHYRIDPDAIADDWNHP